MNKKIILDACCGGRMMWFNKNHPNAIYVDNNPRKAKETDPQKNFKVDPTITADFTNLPFKNSEFKLVVFDPPHLKELSEKSIMRMRYGSLNAQTYPYDLGKGFSECWRVLEDYGVLVFKWNDTQIPFKEVLSFFKETPLFGHTTGSKSKTRWFVFMKIPESAGED